VNVVRAEAAERFVATLRREYAVKTGIEADCFVCTPSDGAFALAKKGRVE
jgi:galactokinase